MIRSRTLHRPMRWLAVIAVLLMACAPPISRWLQARTGPAPSMAICTEMGMAMETMAGRMPAMAHDRHAGADGLAGDAHDGRDGIACDYCVIVAGLLPVALVLLGLLPWRRPACPPMPARRPYPLAAAWPARSARGPPQAA